MASDREDVLRKVRALIAKADDPTVTPEEAASFRAGADRLMTKYAVEEMELLRAGRKATSVEVRIVNVEWWYRQNQDVSSSMWSIFNWTYSHCRCRVMYRHISGTTRTIRVIGFPGDLDWADLLFTHLMLDLERKVDPRPDANTDYYQALKMLREAGFSWNEAHSRMLTGRVMLPADVEHIQPWSAQRDKMLRDYRAWCKRTGTPQNYNHHKTFRRSFTEGYQSGVLNQFYSMRDVQDADDGSGTALVLRDVRQTVEDALYDQYPEYKPEPATKDTIKKGRRIRAYRDSRKRDESAILAGYDAGKQVDMFNSPGERVGRADPDQIDKG